MKIFLLVSLFFTAFYSRAQSIDTTYSGNEIITILRYGYPPDDLYQRWQIAKKYGFRLISISGCLTSQLLVDSATKHNTISYQKLLIRNGENWQKNFEWDITSIYKRDTLIVSKIKNEKFIIAMQADHKIIRCIVDSLLNFSVYRINIIGLNDGQNFSSLRRIFIDYKTFKIVNQDTTVLLLDYNKFMR
ncbi:MAG: hypothetical protein H7296_12025 [Bacteroidia bacterium]|nr:hypothetical protein [Bacteroidia bacterium]